MQAAAAGKFSPEIGFDEVLTLNKILSKYDFDFFCVEGVRSAFKIITDKGVFCMKKLGRGYTRALKSFFIIEHLNNKGFHNTLSFYPAKDGTIFIRNKKSTYYMTHWIEGRESSFNNLEDVLKSAEFMAEFHIAAKGIASAEHFKIRSNYAKTPKDLQLKIKDMEKIKKLLDIKLEKDSFDEVYGENLESVIAEAKKIVDCLKATDMEEYLRTMEEEKYICHDSFYYQNILVGNNDELYIIDLESCLFDIPMIDLGSYIRRMLTKSKYAWDFDLCRKIIESYEKKRKLSQLELQLLYFIIIFPHKFWRLGKKRYIKVKNWSNERYKRKLRKLLELNKYKNEFSDCYKAFYEIDSRATDCMN